MNFFYVLFLMFVFDFFIAQASAPESLLPPAMAAQANEQFHNEAKKTHEDKIAEILQDIRDNGFPRNTGWTNDVQTPTGRRLNRKQYWTEVYHSFIQEDDDRLERLHTLSIAPAQTSLLIIKRKFSTPTSKIDEKSSVAPVLISGSDLKARLQQRRAQLEKETVESSVQNDQ